MTVWICQHHETDGLQPSIILKLMGSCFPLKIMYAIYPKIYGLSLAIIFKQIISTLPLSSNWWSPPFQYSPADDLHPSTILKLMVSTLPLSSNWWSPPFHYPQTDGLYPSTILKLMVSTLPLSSKWWSLPFHYPKNDGLHPSTILKLMVSTLRLSSNWWSPSSTIFNLMVSIFHYPQTYGLYPSSIFKLMVSMVPLSSNCSSPCQRHLIVTFRTWRAGLWVHHHDRAMLCSIFCIRLSFLMMLDLDAAIRSSWSEMARSTSASWAFSGSMARSVTLEGGNKDFLNFFHKQFWPQKSETRMTASTLKQDPNT